MKHGTQDERSYALVASVYMPRNQSYSPLHRGQSSEKIACDLPSEPQMSEHKVAIWAILDPPQQKIAQNASCQPVVSCGAALLSTAISECQQSDHVPWAKLPSQNWYRQELPWCQSVVVLDHRVFQTVTWSVKSDSWYCTRIQRVIAILTTGKGTLE